MCKRQKSLRVSSSKPSGFCIFLLAKKSKLKLHLYNIGVFFQHQSHYKYRYSPLKKKFFQLSLLALSNFWISTEPNGLFLQLPNKEKNSLIPEKIYRWAEIEVALYYLPTCDFPKFPSATDIFTSLAEEQKQVQLALKALTCLLLLLLQTLSGCCFKRNLTKCLFFS